MIRNLVVACAAGAAAAAVYYAFASILPAIIGLAATGAVIIAATIGIVMVAQRRLGPVDQDEAERELWRGNERH